MDSNLITTVVSGAFSVIVGLGAISLKHYLDKKREDARKKENDAITKADVDSMIEIQEFLDGVIDRWELDRGAIYQFHNGGKFFNGVSMKKYSMTHESVLPGIAKTKDNGTVFVTEHPHFIKRLSEENFFTIMITDAEIDYIRDRWEERGVVQTIALPIRSLSNALLGFVTFSMVKVPTIVTEEMQNDLLEVAQRISGYLHY